MDQVGLVCLRVLSVSERTEQSHRFVYVHSRRRARRGCSGLCSDIYSGVGPEEFSLTRARGPSGAPRGRPSAATGTASFPADSVNREAEFGNVIARLPD